MRRGRGGVHHVGLTTLDMDRTIEFYTKKLGFEIGWADIINTEGGGRIKHVFFDSGDGTMLAFMCPEKVPGVPAEFSTDINAAQNLPNAFYHHAFAVESVEALEAKRKELLDKGVDVTVVVDHEWCRSIYLRDPNGLQLEYCVSTREFNEDDKIMRHHEQPGPMVKDPEAARHVFDMLFGVGSAKPKLPRSPV